MKRISLSACPVSTGSGYPAPYNAPCATRQRYRLGDAAGLTQFGVNRLVLPPGAWSSQRHWHSAEDEFILVLEGEVTLVTDAGAEILRVGDCAGFKAGQSDAHHLQNHTTEPAIILEIGSRHPDTDVTEYPGIDLRWLPETGCVHLDGTSYDQAPFDEPQASAEPSDH
jgi:uncharacterized cupin superfamily protein